MKDRTSLQDWFDVVINSDILRSRVGHFGYKPVMHPFMRYVAACNDDPIQ
jgi:hypothetical protein